MVKANYAIKPIAEQALRSNQTIVPQRLIAALDLFGQPVVTPLIRFAQRKSAALLRAEDRGDSGACYARWLPGGFCSVHLQATAAASSGRIAPRGGDAPLTCGKFGRATACRRVPLSSLLSNLLSLRLAAPASAAGDGA